MRLHLNFSAIGGPHGWEMVFCYQNCSDLLWEKIVRQFLVTECFLTCSWRFLRSNKLEQLEKLLGFKNMLEKLEKKLYLLMGQFLFNFFFQFLFQARLEQLKKPNNVFALIFKVLEINWTDKKWQLWLWLKLIFGNDFVS